MTATRVDDQQIKFTSTKTGEHTLGDYMEAAELGDRTLADLMLDLFDSNGNLLETALNDFRGNWVTATSYRDGDVFQDGTTKNLYLATKTYVSSAAIATDVANGNAILLIDVASIITAATASKNAAATSAANAATSESNAANSAIQAEAAAASVGFSDVVFITAANSPYNVTAATAGKLISVDTSAGDVVINLPQISTLVLPFTVGVKKATNDANTITINRGGADTIDGSASKVIPSAFGTTLIPDVDPNPDMWTSADWTGAIIPDGSIADAKLASGVSGTGTFAKTNSPAFTGTATAEAIDASGAVAAGSVAADTTVSDSKGDVRDLPLNVQAGAYQLVASDKGKVIKASGNVTVPATTFAANEAVSVYNHTAGNITITQGAGVVLRLVGTSTTGNRTLALRGLVTILCLGGDEFVISGGGLT